MPTQLLTVKLTGANGYELARKRLLRSVKWAERKKRESTESYFNLRARFPDLFGAALDNPSDEDIGVFFSRSSHVLFPTFTIYIDNINILEGIEPLWLKELSMRPKCTAFACATRWGEDGESVTFYLSQHGKGLMSEECIIGGEQNLPLEKAQLIANLAGRPQTAGEIKALWDNATSARKLADDLSRLLGLMLFTEELLPPDLYYLDEQYEYLDIYRPTEKGLEIYNNCYIDEPLAPPKRKPRATR